MALSYETLDRIRRDQRQAESFSAAGASGRDDGVSRFGYTNRLHAAVDHGSSAPIGWPDERRGRGGPLFRSGAGGLRSSARFQNSKLSRPPPASGAGRISGSDTAA